MSTLDSEILAILDDEIPEDVNPAKAPEIDTSTIEIPDSEPVEKVEPKEPSITVSDNEPEWKIEGRLALKELRAAKKSAETPEEKEVIQEQIKATEKAMSKASRDKTYDPYEIASGYEDKDLLEEHRKTVETLAKQSGFISQEELDIKLANFANEQTQKETLNKAHIETTGIVNDFLTKHPEYLDGDGKEELTFVLDNVFNFNPMLPAKVKNLILEQAHSLIRKNSIDDKIKVSEKKNETLQHIRNANGSGTAETSGDDDDWDEAIKNLPMFKKK